MKIDRTDPAIAKALDTIGTMYAKFGDIHATVVSEQTPVETVLADGTRETVNVAEPGDFIVTNPGGERYVVKPDKFVKLYDPKNEEPGVYVPKGQVVAVKNPFGVVVTMTVSWGEQAGAADCWFADTYNPQTGVREGKPRIIGAKEFAETYKIA